MAIKDDSQRILVTLSKEMVQRIDFYRTKIGLTRSAYCAYLIGQGVLSTEKAMGMLDDFGAAMRDNAVKSVMPKAEQMSMSSCADCANPCKDDSDPSALAFCEHFRPAK